VNDRAHDAPLFDIGDAVPPCELVSVERTGAEPLPDEFRSRVAVHTVHDGDRIPPELLFGAHGKPLVDVSELEWQFVRERDWGANLVARKIAAAMGIGSYARCRVARVVIDFNRFPGSTPPAHDDPLSRLAINHPFTAALSHERKMDVLERYYDKISDFFEENLLEDKLILLAIHSYDEENPSRTRRPHLSLLSSMAHYQRHSCMPYGVFDPLYPDVLGESTCSPILRDRLALNLERTGFRVQHNHPYPLPEGSLEVRAQVWYFFRYLRRRFEEAYPETREDESFRLVWLMLFNTNLRVGDCEAFRGYLHRYRKVPAAQRERFHAAERAYQRVKVFLDASTVIDDFRRSKERPSSIGIEVRKDLVCSFDPDTGRPLPLTEEQEAKATLIGNVIAGAIVTYFDTDRQFL